MHRHARHAMEVLEQHVYLLSACFSRSAHNPCTCPWNITLCARVQCTMGWGRGMSTQHGPQKPLERCLKKMLDLIRRSPHSIGHHRAEQCEVIALSPLRLTRSHRSTLRSRVPENESLIKGFGGLPGPSALRQQARDTHSPGTSIFSPGKELLWRLEILQATLGEPHATPKVVSQSCDSEHGFPAL